MYVVEKYVVTTVILDWPDPSPHGRPTAGTAEVSTRRAHLVQAGEGDREFREEAGGRPGI